MIVHIKDYGVEPEFDDLDAFLHEDKRPITERTAPRAVQTRRAFPARTVHAIAPILEADDDLEDFDVSAFVERTYQ